MKQNGQPSLQQFLGSKEALQQVAKSPDARALAELLTKSQDQAALQKIAQDAAKGDTAQLGRLVQSIASSPGGAELLQRLSQSIGRK